MVERSEKEIADMVKKRVERVESVRVCRQVNVRMTGKRFDVNLHLGLDSNLRFEDVHKIVSDVEREVRALLRNARVTVETEPVGNGKHDLSRIVKETAESVPGSRGVHDIHIQRVDGKLLVDLHLEVRANMTLKQAHEITDEVERMLKAKRLNISEATIHIESASDVISSEMRGDNTEVKWYVEHLAKRFPEIKKIRGIKVRKIGTRTHVSLRCRLTPDIEVKRAHEISNKLEKMIRDAFPDVDRIDVHEEPT
ncbi:MAG: cation transporter dimerization domain-containing protein [archaeon]